MDSKVAIGQLFMIMNNMTVHDNEQNISTQGCIAHMMRGQKLGLLLLVIICIGYAYLAASDTATHDNAYFTLLNFAVILFFMIVFVVTWCVPSFLLLGLYKLRGKTVEDAPNSHLYLTCFLGLFLALYAAEFFSDFYRAFQSSAVEVIYGDK